MPSEGIAGDFVELEVSQVLMPGRFMAVYRASRTSCCQERWLHRVWPSPGIWPWGNEIWAGV